MTNRTAADSSEFAAARSAAVAGDTIELTTPNGVYSSFNWNTGYASEVAVFSTDPANTAIISSPGFSSNINGLQNVTFRDIMFSKPWQSGDGNQDNFWRADNTHNLWFDKCRIQGGKVNNGTDSNGRFIQAIGGSNMKFTNCDISEWTKFLVMGGHTNITVSYCEIYDIKSDGITFDAISGGLINFNYFHDFAVGVTEEHPDMIQYTRNASRVQGVNDLVTEYNVFDQGIGRYGQGNFGGTGGQSIGGPGTAFRHERNIIRHNIFFIDHKNVISMYAFDNGTVENNLLIDVENGYPFTSSPEITLSPGDGNIVRNNICAAFNPGGNPVDTSNNQTVNPSNLLTYFDWLHKAETGDAWNGVKMKSGTSVSTSNAGPYIVQKAAGWNGNEVEAHPAYPDRIQLGGSTPVLPDTGNVDFSINAT